MIPRDNDRKVTATDCQAYGIIAGCDEYCPVLIAGLCELQDNENKVRMV